MIEVQKSLGRIEGSFKSFSEETLRRLDVLEKTERKKRGEVHSGMLATISCMAAVATAVSRYIH